MKCRYGGISSGSTLLAKTKSIFTGRNITFLRIMTFDPSMDTMDHLDLTVSYFMGNSIGLKRAKEDVMHMQ